MKLVVIPARGGSKRIPRKNIRPFAGKPMIAHSIEAAKACALFDHIVVSTDDDEIAEVARRFGAEVPFMRPAELADDHTGMMDVIKHAIRWFQAKGETADYTCCIYATAPFVRPRYVREAYERLCASDKSFALAVTTYAFPVQRSVQLEADGSVVPRYPQYAFTRSQDLEEVYHDCGQFFWGRTEAILGDVVALSRASLAIVMPRYLVQDIDTPEDWRRAELMHAALKETGE